MGIKRQITRGVKRMGKDMAHQRPAKGHGRRGHRMRRSMRVERK
jgi:hypothetical protein